MVIGGVWQSDMNTPIVILPYYGVGGACPLQFPSLRGIYAWLVFNARQGCKPVNCTQSNSYKRASQTITRKNRPRALALLFRRETAPERKNKIA
jgi:hypothetical protein